MAAGFRTPAAHCLPCPLPPLPWKPELFLTLFISLLSLPILYQVWSILKLTGILLKDVKQIIHLFYTLKSSLVCSVSWFSFFTFKKYTFFKKKRKEKKRQDRMTGKRAHAVTNKKTGCGLRDALPGTPSACAMAWVTSLHLPDPLTPQKAFHWGVKSVTLQLHTKQMASPGHFGGSRKSQ